MKGPLTGEAPRLTIKGSLLPSISWSVSAPLLLILGALTYRLILGLSLWRVHHEPAHVWAAAWCAAAMVFVGARAVQRIGYASDSLVEVSVIAQYLGALLLLPASLVVAHAIADREPTRGQLARLGGATALASVILIVVLWYSARGITSGVDAVGQPLRTLKAGPAALVLPPLVAWVTLRSARVLREGEPHPRFGWALVAVAVALGLLGLNDALLAAGALRSVQLAHFGIAAVTLSGGYILTSRVSERQKRLDLAIAARTVELERALEEVRQGEARFRTLADSAVEGVIVHDSACVQDSNEATSRMTGHDSAILRGRDIVTLFDEASAVSVRRLLSAAERGPVQVRGLRKDGTTFPAEVKVARVASGNGQLGVLTILDTSERDEINRRLLLADRMASLGTLAAGAAHEINNPLAFVRLNLEHAEEQIDGGSYGNPASRALQDLRALVGESRDGCDRIGRVVSDLRTLSRQDDDAGGAKGPVDLGTVARTAAKMASHEIRHRARLVETYAEAVYVEGDDGRLTQVCLNLLINAAHAIPTGHASDNEVAVTVRREGDTAVLEVADTGTGIAPETLPQIFDPFFTTKPTGMGTGLGLSICHTIVTAAGGDIGVDSGEGGGTRVRITLPLASAPAAPADPKRRISLPNVEVGAILVVDDEVTLTRSIARALNGCAVTVVMSGKDAIVELERQSFDMVLCDLMMPETGGVDVFAYLKANQPRLASRFVLMTGANVGERARDVLGEVADRILEKPLDMELLRRTVDRVLASVP